MTDRERSQEPGFGRRDLMKMSAGMVVAGLTTQPMAAQDSTSQLVPVSRARTGPGWKNTSNRASGNGPMDETSRRLVEYVGGFGEKQLTEPIVDALEVVMVDAMACLIAGFESESTRICARLARTTQSDLKSTVMGYGITTTPELATFANATMVRYADFNDAGWGGHLSDMIPAILAVGEAVHATGPQVLVAITLSYEVMGALSGARLHTGWDSPYMGLATALAVGKLLTLNEDQLANAISFAVVPHMPMFISHVGALSHWKNCHDAEAVRCGVWAALMARAGMTGPCQPFEGRGGLWDNIGRPSDVRLPAMSDGRMVVQDMFFKPYPAEFSSLALLGIVPEFRAWTRIEDIASIRIELSHGSWMETSGATRWDPRNHETADHSMPYLIVRALMDGEVYLDSFTPSKIMDPVARALMERTTVHFNPEFPNYARSRMTVRTTAGGELTKDATYFRGHQRNPMSLTERHAKFNRVCDYMRMEPQQRQRALAHWSNLKDVEDIAAPIGNMAKFGQPKPL